MDGFFRRLLYYFRRRQFESELDEEMQHHATLSGRPKFGNVTLLKEDSRAMWTWTFWEQLGQDLRYALRTIANNKAFTALAALSLALGIGANTAIYSFMDSILLRSLPVQNPESLAVLNWHSKPRSSSKGGKGTTFVMHAMSGNTYGDSKSGTTAGIFPFPAFELLAKDDSSFSSVFAFYPAGRLNLAFKGQADIANGEYVSGDYFRGLDVPPASGRLLLRDDDRAGAPPVAVISFAFSQSHFGGTANITGQSILINNIPFTVAGVTPPEFFGTDPAAAPDVYLPMHANLLLNAYSFGGQYLDQNYYWIQIMARLRSGVSLAQAQATLATPFHQWVESTATNDKERANLPELLVSEGAGGLDTLRRQYSKPLYFLLTLVGLILAIACANIANLLLARAAARRREIALRLSVGAGRFRVIRQLLTESVVLASLGGVLGVLFAIWGIRFLTLLLANGQSNFTLRADLNWHVLGAAAALSLLTGGLFGLAPAIQSTRVDVMPALKEIRSSQAHPRFRVNLSQMLIASQMALSLLILVSAGLFVRTLANLQSVELGFNRENLLLFQLNARQVGHLDPEIASFYGDLQRQFARIPGVRNVSLSHTPLINSGTGLPISIAGTETNGTRVLFVGPAFFTTMQIPMLLGRDFEERDRPDSPAVAIVSESFAKTNFGDENPLGQHVTLGGRNITPVDMQIVGVSRDARYGGLKRDVPPVVYMPYHLQPGYYPLNQMTYELRTAGDPLAYVNSIREIVKRADSRVPVTNVETQVAEIDQTINQEITFAKLCTAFGLLALLIACVGLYGTMSYAVARRTAEIGIRMALGARQGGVVWMVLRQVFVLAIAGLAIGLPTALAASKFVESFLFGTKPDDPIAITVAVAVLVAAAVIAGYAPARRASKIDPMVALRHE